MKKSIFSLALLLCLSAWGQTSITGAKPVVKSTAVTAPASALLKFDVPYAVPPEVQEGVEGSNTWVEVYRVAPKDLKSARDQLVNFSQVPPAVSVGFGPAMGFSIRKKPTTMVATGFALTRRGAPITYDTECNTRPEVGDLLTTRYATQDGELEASFTVSVIDYFAFGSVNPQAAELVSLDVTQPNTCALIQQSRTLYQGALTLKRKGVVQVVEPVMMQSIME